MNRAARLRRALVAVSLAAGLAGAAHAQEGTAKALASWEGQGQIFQIEPTKAIFMGAFNGILYVETGDEALDALLMLCPGSQEISLDDYTTIASGYCTFEHASGDRVFAKWHCAGEVGACNGNMTLTGGTGAFEGITGGGEMSVRTVLADMAANLESGSIVRSAAGLAVWPKLDYRIPAR
ncbi:MAG: hypothetical protein R3286_14005 [Gammaproteobacteria bacterium]|nr:hypothetical protein [Gammaproteobacteria bacterium]